MSCDRFTGVRRFIGLYLEKLEQHGDDCAVTLSDVLPVQNIEVVANLDLCRVRPQAPPRHAAALVRQWLAPRGKAVRQ
jgi:hypothetical protein